MVEHLRALGFVSKLSKWVSHQLTDVQRQRRVEGAVSLLSFRLTKTWVNFIVTGNEKRVLDPNIQPKRS